jgi:hypothetical protein
MEILRFDAEPTPARKSRRPIKGVFVVGLVAATFGIGSAFATSTITVNDNNTVQLGQGVTAVTACDNAISISPLVALDPIKLDAATPSALPSAFGVTGIEVGAAGGDQGISGNCDGKIFKVQVFKENKSLVTCDYFDAYDDDASIAGSPALTCVNSAIYFQYHDDSSGDLIVGLNGDVNDDQNVSADDFGFITLETVGSIPAV